MRLAPGTRIGPFEITAQIGAGGMGEVYRAIDTNLKRAVAIKVLPPSVVADSDRLARFQREAELLAALNHPQIAQIYGIEGTGVTRALVMELVEGPTLADRIAQGALPSDETVALATQIAAALEAAHQRGIIHRDLKPANIKVRSDGTVKVLDFGLAKALDTTAGVSVADAVSMSPTMTAPAMTQAGIILGTAAYMSPEQANGRGVDERADIWAFGVVCWEMLTGRALFARESLPETLAAVLKEEPTWDDVPPSLRRVLELCLRKDVRQRLRNAGDVRLLIGQQTQEDPSQLAVFRPVNRISRLLLLLAVAAGGAIAGAAMAWTLSRPRPDALVYLSVGHPPPESIGGNDFDDNIAISPDGRLIAYVTGSASTTGNTLRLYARALDQRMPVLLSTSARTPFFSPDGQSVGFVEGNMRLSRVAISGGPSVVIGGSANAIRGASWGDSGIVYATSELATGLLKISPLDGTMSVLTRADTANGEVDHVFPDVLPQGRGVLFAITGANPVSDSRIGVYDERTQKYKTLVPRGSHPRFVKPGHLVFGSAGTLLAAPFDLERLELRGTPVPVMDGVATRGSGSVPFAVAANGTLAYLETFATGRQQTLVWVDHTGREERLGVGRGSYASPAVSPDGSQVAVTVETAVPGESDIWVWSVKTRTFNRLTFEAGAELEPLWTPDGTRIVYQSNRSGANLMWRAADGTGAAEPLLDAAENAQRILVSPGNWTPDGRLIFDETRRGGESRIGAVLPGRAASTLISETRFRVASGRVSPDGRWLAYTSTESGLGLGYVRPFPGVNGGKWQVSTRGAVGVRWSTDGRTLYIISNEGGLGVKVTTTSSFAASEPAPVPGLSGNTLDVAVAPDGRFLLVRADDTVPAPRLNVVLNWAARLAP